MDEREFIMGTIHNLKLHSAIVVEKANSAIAFKKYFKHSYYVENNARAFEYFLEKRIAIVILYCDEKTTDTLDVINAIRKEKNETIIIVISYNKESTALLNLLNADVYHLKIDKIKEYVLYDKTEVKNILQSVEKNLERISNNIIYLLDNYCYNREKKTLYSPKLEKIRLSKNETLLLDILSKKTEKYFPAETLEYQIWEDESIAINCDNRLKNLLFGLRKKLPKGSIVNIYNWGYTLVIV